MYVRGARAVPHAPPRRPPTTFTIQRLIAIVNFNQRVKEAAPVALKNTFKKRSALPPPPAILIGLPFSFFNPCVSLFVAMPNDLFDSLQMATPITRS